MKKHYCVILCLCFLLVGCAFNESEEDTVPTGYPSGEISQPQIMYNETLYLYFATGFDEQLPDTFSLAGYVENVDNVATPNTNWSGSRVEVGQKVYADTNDPNHIYLEYETGYAKFSCKDNK